MTEHIVGALNGAPVLQARVTLRRGGRPSTCQAVLPPGAQPAVGDALALLLRDAGTQRLLGQFTCTGVEITGDGRAIVHGADRRRDWPTRRASLPPIQGGALGDALAALFRSAGLPEADAPHAHATLPPLPRMAGTLAALVETLCALGGLTIGTDDDGSLILAEMDQAPAIAEGLLIGSREDTTEASEVIVVGAPPLQLRTITAWQPVIPVGDELRALEDVLTDWGIPEPKARQACLSESGFDGLIGHTAPNAGEHAALLQRYAFRMFRADAGAPWTPVGGVDASGALLPPRVSTKATRTGAIPAHPADHPFETPSLASAVESFELDLERRTLALDDPPYVSAGTSEGDPTRQSRTLVGAPQLSLTIAVESPGEAFRYVHPAGGSGDPVVVNAPFLVPVHSADGATLNAAHLAQHARELAENAGRRAARRTRVLAGVAGTIAVGTVANIEIAAGTAGLTTTVSEDAVAVPGFDAHSRSTSRHGEPVRPAVPDHQPINAWRAGPLVLRAADGVNEAESVVAMEATAQETDTGALTLDHPGALAFPFFLPSDDAAKFGRWFFVAGAESLGDGRIRVLAPDDRHAPVDAPALGDRRLARPEGLRGLLVSTGDQPAFIESGPLISDARGRSPGTMSDLVADIDGSRVSEHRRGGLHLLTVLALSPVHQRAGLPGWAPALNFRDTRTGNHAVSGRGLFAEDDGKSLGHLAASGNGGPVLGDSAHCSKHAYGVASADDGVYRESAGHLSTEAFFKVPGDAQHDAPLTFYRQPFRGGVPPWPPYEAQLKYHAASEHEWDGQKRPGRWKIQYRVPFLPVIPPTWRPPIRPPDEPPPEDPPGEPPPWVPVPILPPEDIVPVISENEIWAPSHDWVPAPSDREQQQEVPFPGPSIKSEGWAGESEGHPDPAQGGGVIFLPPDRGVADNSDDGDRDTWVVLHPEVSLGFGLPGFENGTLLDGWAIQLDAPGGDLLFTPVNEEGNADESPRAVQINGDAAITGKLTVSGLIDPTGLQLDPQANNPGAAPTLWAHTGGRPRWGDTGQLALLGDLVGVMKTAVVSYTGTGISGHAVALTGINRAHALALMGRSSGVGIALALPGGATGALTFKHAATGSNEASFSLDAPAAGVAQALTINNTLAAFNDGGEVYDILVIGT